MKRYKITTFVPVAETETVLTALGNAGAGRIGEYTLCSYVIRGQGRFLPGKSARPAIGEIGKLEVVDENRIEMVCDADKLKDAVEALLAVHPYEEVAYDIVELVEVEDL